MRLLTVAAALFASTSLAVPTYPDNGGGACVSKPPVGGSSSYPGGEPSSRYTSSAPGTQPTGTGTTSGPGSSSTTSRRTRTKHTKPTHTKPTHTNTSSGPATTTTGSNTGSNTSTGPPTTSTGNTSPPGEFKCSDGLYSVPQCCSVDILGVADVDCASPNKAPTSGDEFKSICAAGGKQARCCVVPVLGQDVLCKDISGGGNPPGGNPPGGNPPGGNPPGGNPPGGNPPYDACPSGLYSNLQCCATDVLGVADLDCKSPSSVPTSAAEFMSVCAAAGQRARCCVVPVLGQAVLCETAVGTE